MAVSGYNRLLRRQGERFIDKQYVDTMWMGMVRTGRSTYLGESAQVLSGGGVRARCAAVR